MEFVKKLDSDMIASMKEGKKLRLTVLREIKAGMKQANIDQKKEMNDELLIEVVSKGVKTRRESIKEFEKGNRSDLIDKTKEEITILEEYLPKQLEEEELRNIIDEVFNKVNPTSMKDMGKVMGMVTPLVKGRADMSLVSSIIKSKLNG